MIFRSMQDIIKATEGKLITLNEFKKKVGKLKNQCTLTTYKNVKYNPKKVKGRKYKIIEIKDTENRCTVPKITS